MAQHTVRGRLLGAAAVTAALLVPLAVFGEPAIAKTASAAWHQYGSSSSCGQYGSSGAQYGASGGEYGSSGAQYGSSSCRQYRVQICQRRRSRKHPWVLITVNFRTLQSHLRHGDKLPPCIQPSPRHKKHGHGGGGDGKGNQNQSQSQGATVNTADTQAGGHGKRRGHKHH